MILAATVSTATAGNMNGKYSVASVDKQDVPFNDDYASKGHEYFDVWAPEIATTYGENFWTNQGNTPLPDHIVKRFAGKIMAITGYEQDQVMVDPVGQPGVNPERDVSVPINWAYNHHYMAWMTGEHSQMVEVEADPNDVSAHGAPTRWVAVDRPSAARRANTVAPTSQMFSEGNGGESRKSFHGYPKGFAQLIDSPKTWTITPMQIDTRRRDCGVTRDSIHNCTKFEPWIEPRQARYGRPAEAGTNNSAILECPCNSRFGGDPIFYPDAGTKYTEHNVATIPSGVCRAGQRFSKAEDCFSAARTLGIDLSALSNVSVSDTGLPAGCLIVSRTGGKVAATFNSASSKAACPASQLRQGKTTSAANVTFELALDATKPGGEATMTLSGPASGWFGVGLNARLMSDAPYTLITNASGTFEQKIGTCGSEAEHCPGDRLGPSLTLVSNTVTDGVRTVVVRRAFAGLTKDHYTFDPTKLNILPLITAIGYEQTFAYHKSHSAAMLTLLSPEGMSTCLCDEGTIHSLCDTNRRSCQSWTKNCLGPWDGQPLHTGADLFTQRNPTCNSGQYAGGLRCCGHKRVMLDVDQDPGPDLLRYHMKFRFWFQEYDAGSSFPGTYLSRTGSLPSGYDALPSATTTISDALATCTASKVCRSITFQSDDQMAHSQPVKVYFKNGTTYVNEAAGWHSWVEQTKPSHYDLPRYYYTTEAYAGEYDIPPAFRRATDPEIPGYTPWPASSKGDMHLTPGSTCTGDCPDGPDCECVHTITYHWTMSNARMLYAGGHCHAPSCISIELYRNDTGTPELICRQASKYGQGDVAKDRFDEAGYVVLPPCLWGSEDEGLEPPSWLPYGTPMFSIKRNRNTHSGHYGEMASWQMRGVPFPASETTITV
eukprot:CAMPEP_0174696172 /NCGR_PEP_ID=MMETSP1094-20130205/2390_1 /TAXON_ID=156173 /ORGANISM="Chrysochromulina brevifilum, Strain UTEX LB 985" /LENGTH=884 /DNA_ID=CAMNT_0015892883 /DNA_START=17 /DNA_END=2671 /DNA_ORIENTATION=+